LLYSCELICVKFVESGSSLYRDQRAKFGGWSLGLGNSVPSFDFCFSEQVECSAVIRMMLILFCKAC